MNEVHRNPSGGQVLACDADTDCKKLTCEVCMKEVPADAVQSMDVQDYVHHFCGLDCLEAWKRQLKR